MRLHTSHCTPSTAYCTLHAAHRTKQAQCTADVKCLVVWFFVHESTVHVLDCLSISLISNLDWKWVLPERKLFITVSFWYNSDLLCFDRSRAGCSNSYRESYSRFPPQLWFWRIPKSVFWILHCNFVLPERSFLKLFHFGITPTNHVLSGKNPMLQKLL